jgi:hypothetical protein
MRKTVRKGGEEFCEIDQGHSNMMPFSHHKHQTEYGEQSSNM